VDEHDAEFKADEKLQQPKEVKASELAPHEFVALRFGSALLIALSRSRILDTQAQPPAVTLATSLPRNPYQNVAFRSSFFFDVSNNVLFVRKERLQNMGGFVLVLIHVWAHIASGQWDDRDKAFMGNFLACVRALCSDLVMARAYAPLQLAPPPVAGSIPKDTEKGLERKKTKTREKQPLPPPEALDRLLGMQPTSLTSKNSLAIDTPFFNKERLLKRMEQYDYFHRGAALGQQLLDMEKADQREFESEVQARHTMQARQEAKAPTPLPQSLPEMQRANLEIDEGVLGNLSDSLNSDLLDVVAMLRAKVAAQARLQDRLDQAGGEDDLAALKTELHQYTSTVNDLSLRKDVLLQRLRDVDAALASLSRRGPVSP